MVNLRYVGPLVWWTRVICYAIDLTVVNVTNFIVRHNNNNNKPTISNVP